MEPLSKLQELIGVGPATATLLLSLADPDDVPFFSDETYAWLCRRPGEEEDDDDDEKEETRGPRRKGGAKVKGKAGSKAEGGGKLKLRYNWKEYGELFDAVQRLRRRLADEGSQGEKGGKKAAVGALDVEKVSWVLGHYDAAEDVLLPSSVEERGLQLAEKEDSATMTAASAAAAKKRKRKASNTDGDGSATAAAAAAATRKSTRSRSSIVQ